MRHRPVNSHGPFSRPVILRRALALKDYIRYAFLGECQQNPYGAPTCPPVEGNVGVRSGKYLFEAMSNQKASNSWLSARAVKLNIPAPAINTGDVSLIGPMLLVAGRSEPENRWVWVYLARTKFRTTPLCYQQATSLNARSTVWAADRVESKLILVSTPRAKR